MPLGSTNLTNNESDPINTDPSTIIWDRRHYQN